ncbi:MAG: hypothetical protein OEX02_07010 [Cyclobacteriaceae bacterium]|nr:hypothetical protein [Cyclobacteriaceae bacterium]
MYKSLKIYFGLLSLWAFTPVFGQIAPSPFMASGIGQISSMGLIQNESMGGLGIGTGSFWNINNDNPALLVYSRNTYFGNLTVFQAGMLTESKKIENADNLEKSGGTGMSYLAMGFPIMKNKWYSTLGLRPYSTVNYNLNYDYDVPGSGSYAKVTEKGSGGINQLYISNGAVLTKNISVGLRSAFMFGSRVSEFTNYIVDSIYVPQPYSGTIYQRRTSRGFTFSGGIAYQDSIKMGTKDPLRVTVGAVYDIERAIAGKEFESLQRRSLGGAILEADTLINNRAGKVVLPSGWGAGISVGQGSEWLLGADIRFSQWSKFQQFGEQPGFMDSFSLGVGGETTPDAFSVDQYLKRVTYRMGFHYKNTPYLLNNMEIKDFGINFGVSLPIVPSSTGGSGMNKGFSSVDMSFTFGKQGNVEDNLLAEKYFRFHFGITFNDQWFVRRKFN